MADSFKRIYEVRDGVRVFPEFYAIFDTNRRIAAGNENQNTIITLVSSWMEHAGLEVELLTYDFLRCAPFCVPFFCFRSFDYGSWDPRWWSLSLTLTNGTKIGLPTTGYWPYSGNSGLGGVTAQVYDAGTYAIHDTISQTSDNSTLLAGFASVPAEGGIVFFDNPSPTRNYSLPGYKVLGTGRDIEQSEIPEVRSVILHSQDLCADPRTSAGQFDQSTLAEREILELHGT